MLNTFEGILYTFLLFATLFIPWYYFGWQMALTVFLVIWVNSVVCTVQLKKDKDKKEGNDNAI